MFCNRYFRTDYALLCAAVYLSGIGCGMGCFRGNGFPAERFQSICRVSCYLYVDGFSAVLSDKISEGKTGQ